MKIGIITDSATGFSLEEMAKYPDIMVVPLVIIDQDNIVYEDNQVAINSQKIFDKLIKEKQHLKTSQSNSETVREAWRKSLKDNDEVLFLPIANDASGQYARAFVMQKEDEFFQKVHVYETGAAAIPLKFMALIAFTLSKQGKTITEIKVELDKFRKDYQMFLGIDNLTYLQRGGRIPASLATVANFLRLKPILSCKEKTKQQKIKRTMNHAIKDMLELIIEKTKNAINETLYVLNAWCDKELIDKAVAQAKAFGFTNVVVTPLCNILQTHTGNNTIGFSVVPNAWIQEI